MCWILDRGDSEQVTSNWKERPICPETGKCVLTVPPAPKAEVPIRT